MTLSITIVVPAFNAESTILETIDSVRKQTFSDWSMVVVDDGSTDRTVEVVRGIPDPRIAIARQANQGQGAARNAGLALVKSQNVLFLDADDMLHPTALERLTLAFDRNPSAVAVFGATLRFTEDGALEPGQKPPEQHRFQSGDILQAMIRHDRVFWNGGQVLISAKAARAANGYNPDLRIGEDWEFFCRLSALGPCIFIGPQAEILRHRVSSRGVTATLSHQWSGDDLAINTVFSNPDLRARFSAAQWGLMRRENIASAMFESARQNFRKRNFSTARWLMIRSLGVKPSRKRLALFVLSIGSQMLNRPLHGRLRFAAPASQPENAAGQKRGTKGDQA